MSDSVQPHPWDSPGKNTGVGCHFLLQCMKVKSLSHVRLFATPWTAAYQASLSLGFSRQEYWSGVPLPSPVGRLVLCKLWYLKVVHMRSVQSKDCLVKDLHLSRTCKEHSRLYSKNQQPVWKWEEDLNKHFTERICG